MCMPRPLVGALLASSLAMVWQGEGTAAEVRFHYVPVDANGNTALQPAGAGGTVGVRVRWLEAVQETYHNQPRPTHLVTFRHPYSGRAISVPLAFPPGTPRLGYTRTRVIYNYGSYTVEALFLRDGSVDIIYNSGLLRSP